MFTYDTLLAAVAVKSGRTVESRNPATDQLIGLAPENTIDELDPVIAAASAAQPGWAALSDEDRRSYLHRAADAIEESAEALAQLLSREQGKPLNGLGARWEVGGAVAWLRSTADIQLPGEVLVDDGSTQTTMHYRPIGVVGAITPWNYPMNIAMWQIAPSLRMGNTVVSKPSETTTLSGLALIEVMNQVLPAGVLNAITGPGATIGDALVKDARIGKIMFTGSTATGKRIIEASAGNVTRLTLELGGNDAAIVLSDVDPEEIVEDLFWGAFINTGQTCCAAKRLYVHDSVYDEVVTALASFAEKVPVGEGLDEEVLLGPLHNQRQFEIVSDLVEKARASGARVVLGGNPDPEAEGFFYPVTLVADIDNDNDLVLNEQFGPALPIMRYTDLDEAIRLANSLEVGLGASVWSSNADRAREVAMQLEAGTVWINSHGILAPHIPFGGIKQSGYGLEFGVEGLKSVSVPFVISG